ncbi:Uncharacterised protein [Vibrio cholerae]|nr:Uncharacterised protein [Vibrio cholerae]
MSIALFLIEASVENMGDAINRITVNVVKARITCPKIIQGNFKTQFTQYGENTAYFCGLRE